MTSPTDITERRRAAKKRAGGADRKKIVRAQGTTPVLFALNKPVKSNASTSKHVG